MFSELGYLRLKGDAECSGLRVTEGYRQKD